MSHKPTTLELLREALAETAVPSPAELAENAQIRKDIDDTMMMSIARDWEDCQPEPADDSDDPHEDWDDPRVGSDLDGKPGDLYYGYGDMDDY